VPQEVLMPRSVHHTRLSHPSLFHPPPFGPQFQTLPPDVKAKAIRLLARLLRLEVDQRRAGEAQEADDE
jgi:hypothetical protein